MTDPGQTPATPAAPELQFDRLEPTSDATTGATAPSVDGIVCASCGTVMLDEYHSIGGKPICASCRTSVEAMRATSRTPKAFGKAFIFGLGAALAGAAVYFGVYERWRVEWSLITIFIGWMIGRAIQKALPGGSLRRYQVLAAVLTYFAVGTAYAAIMVYDMKQDAAAKKQDSAAVVAQQGTHDSAAVAAQVEKPAASSSAATKAGIDESTKKKRASFLVRTGVFLAFAFALPVVIAFSSGSGGILTVVIIAIGIYQAWRMTGAPALKITGPFRVGGDAIAAGAS